MSQTVDQKPLSTADNPFNLSGISQGQSLLGDFRVGTKNIKVDGKNKRILILDENDIARVLIGYQENGF